MVKEEEEEDEKKMYSIRKQSEGKQGKAHNRMNVKKMDEDKRQ